MGGKGDRAPENTRRQSAIQAEAGTKGVREATASSMRQLAREVDACRDMLVALGNENRQRIFIALLENPGGIRVGALAELARLSRPATSHHLKLLKDAGLADSFKRGTKNYYHASARLDRWAQLAQVTAHAEQFVRIINKLDAQGAETCCTRPDDTAQEHCSKR